MATEASADEETEKVKENGNVVQLISAGCSVILDVNDGERFVFAKLNSAATIKLGNMKCSLEPLIGYPFGSSFEIIKGPKGFSLTKISHQQTDNTDNGSEFGLISIDKDNRSLIDDNTAQSLSGEEIRQLRSEVVSGQEIVDALIANSATYQTKTTFSQDKYKKKKQKKYNPRIVVRFPTARSVCDAYFLKSPCKTGFMRMDMLALMLSLGNVGAHGHILVLDMLGGLLTAAIAERLGGLGSLCCAYDDDTKPQPLDIVGLFNFDSATMSCISRAAVSDLVHARNRPSNESENLTEKGAGVLTGLEATPSDEPDVMSESNEKALTGQMAAERDAETTCMQQDDEINVKEATGNATKVLKHVRQAMSNDISHWAKQGFSSLIIGALGLEPWSYLQHLLPLLSPSSPFVIYSPSLEPLSHCMHQLQKARLAVAMQLSEPWFREYQVLPSRTHPHMQMSGTGGYVLSGIRVL